MLIENPDAFKSWLTGVLEPLCDADPAALAKYVYALVKKDKPLDELRDGMIDQLDVFLQSETKPFVELLFKSLETHDYLKPSGDEKRSDSPSDPSKLSHDRNDNAQTHKAERRESAVKERDADVKGKQPDVAKNQRIVLNRATKFVPAIVPKEKPAYATEQTLVKVIPDLLEDSLNEQLPVRSSKRDKKSDSDKEERRKRTYKSRSRSRSWDRARRPPGGSRPLWRNRSPPSQANRYERRRSRSGSPPVRAPRYRNRSPPPCSDPDLPTNRSRSRSRERNASPGPNPPRDRPERVSRERERDRQSRNRDRVDREKIVDRDREREDRSGRGRECVSGTATPTQDSNPGDNGPQIRGTTTLAGIFTPVQKKRCRDFDEKGFCMRGDLCQFDHGADPVVLEEALSHMLALPMTRPPPRHPLKYNPLTPDIWARGAGSGSIYATPPPPYFPFLNAPPHQPVQRELIPVLIERGENVPPNNNAPPAINNGTRASAAPGAPLAPVSQTNNHLVPPPTQSKKKSFDFNRLGPNRHVPKSAGGNCSLELKKVPRGLNDIMHLNNHFSKFGKIVNIQVCYEDDPEAALITFSSHTEANVAYKSTEAVLNNRFIKVFWHNVDPNKQESQPPRIPAKERLTNSHHPHVNNNNHVSHNKVLINKDTTKINNNLAAENKPTPNVAKDEEITKNGEEATSTTVTNEKKEQIAVISLADTTVKQDSTASAELAAMVRRRGEGAAKLARDLSRRSQQLLDKQLQQQRLLIQRLESGKVTDAQKETLVKAIKDMQKTIEKTRKELVSLPKSIPQLEDSYVVNSLSKMTLSSSKRPMAKKAAFGNLKKTPRSKEEAQKEILDAELDLITKQQEGQDVSELQKYVAELKRQQHAFKPITPRRASVNRLSPRARFNKSSAGGKAGMFVNQSVDHRPCSFLVSGYESDELEQLIKHFTQFGEIVEHVSDTTTPSLWLQFRTRKIAEQAALKGRQFNDRTLTVTWQPKSTPITQPTHEEGTSKTENFEQQSPIYSNRYHLDSPLFPSEDAHWNIPSYNMGDSEDEEGKEYDKEEERSWRR